MTWQSYSFCTVEVWCWFLCQTFGLISLPFHHWLLGKCHFELVEFFLCCLPPGWLFSGYSFPPVWVDRILRSHLVGVYPWVVSPCQLSAGGLFTWLSKPRLASLRSSMYMPRVPALSRTVLLGIFTLPKDVPRCIWKVLIFPSCPVHTVSLTVVQGCAHGVLLCRPGAWCVLSACSCFILSLSVWAEW